LNIGIDTAIFSYKMAVCMPELLPTQSFFAIEVTKSSRVREADVGGLKAFLKEYPNATAFLLYGGADRYYEDAIHYIPVTQFFSDAIHLIFPES
jgi:hypothetical protein